MGRSRRLQISSVLGLPYDGHFDMTAGRFEWRAGAVVLRTGPDPFTPSRLSVSRVVGSHLLRGLEESCSRCGIVIERLPSDEEEDKWLLPNGTPRCAVDLPCVQHGADLAYNVVPAWEEAGIECSCYSSGTTGVLMMLADPSREAEAERIKLRIWLELERHLDEFGPAELPLPDSSWGRLGSIRRAGRTLMVTVDDDARITPANLYEAIDNAKGRFGWMLRGLLNAEGVIDLAASTLSPEEVRAPTPSPEEVRAMINKIKERSAGRTATATMVDQPATND